VGAGVGSNVLVFVGTIVGVFDIVGSLDAQDGGLVTGDPVVGARVGTADGVSVKVKTGENVGICVGSTLLLFVGSAVGMSVKTGEAVGFADGGAVDGDAVVGARVGIGVGSNLLPFVGIAVGVSVKVKPGEAVGARVLASAPFLLLFFPLFLLSLSLFFPLFLEGKVGDTVGLADTLDGGLIS